MRRSLALALACLFCLPLVAAPTGPAAAQEPPVRLTLLEQTPDWNDRADPTVTVRVRAENTGDEMFDDLSIGITLWSPAVSRTAFEESLTADPPGASVLLGQTRRREGTLAPGETRDFEVPVDLPVGELSSTQSFVYPLKVEVRSRFESLAEVRTAVVYLVREPLFPLAFSWTFVLHAQLVLRPDGTFGSPSLETAISPGGRLAGQISALSHLVRSGVGVNVVVSPLLVYQLLQMRDGYDVLDDGAVRAVEQGRGGSAAAGTAIARLRRIANASNVELSALPYAEPLLPALTSGGLARDLGVQIQLGRDLVASVLGRAPSTTVFRPPRSALDQTSLDELPASGVSTLLLDPGAVDDRADVQGFAPSPLVSLAAQNATLMGVVGDPAVQTMLTSGSEQEDPVLAGHAILAELAEIWLQAPGEQRALAITLGEGLPAPGAFYAPLVRALSTAPWLAKKRASVLAGDDTYRRSAAVSALLRSPSAFSSSYVDELKQARRRVQSLRTMLVRPSGLPARLDRLLLLAESQRFVGDEASGTAFVDDVDETVLSIFGSVQPQVDQPITLTSSSVRDVPIAVRNTAEVPLRVTIRVFGQHLAAPVERTRTLPAGSTQTVTMDLQLQTTGRFTVRVQVLTPSGRPVGGRDLIVRSTAYNRVALLITIGAAALALLVWARRFLPRRTV